MSAGDCVAHFSLSSFLTSLPNVASKKRSYSPLEIVRESGPLQAFSQERVPILSDEDFRMEQSTMTDSQYQRYEMLNNENSIFLSSQLEQLAFNPGQTADPKATQRQPTPTKRSASNASIPSEPCKRRRWSETMPLNWKIMSLKSIKFKPLSNGNFHLEFQMRNNYDTFHLQDPLSIKRFLQLNDLQWNDLVNVLTAVNGYEYNALTTSATTVRKLDLLSKLLHYFVQSAQLAIRSPPEFADYMGHCVEVAEQQLLKPKCVDVAIDPNIRKKMEEIKKKR